MIWLKKNLWEIVLVFGLFSIGLFFRLKGISSNNSFWADEAFVSSFSRSIVLGTQNFWDALSLLHYQRFQIVTVATFFKLFGVSEWSARLPSVLWGSIGIIFAYLVAKKHSNKSGGFLAAFLFTFLQLNLAHSTQAKPYAAIETLLLMSLYFSDKNLAVAFILATIATLYNYVGVIVFFPLIPNVLYRLKGIRITPVSFVFFMTIVVALGWFLHIDTILSTFLHPRYNWTTYLRDLFWRQFVFITLPAIFGLFLIKDKKVFWSISIALAMLLFSWTFFSFRNIRYLMPAIGTLVVLFGIFWGRVEDTLFRRSALVCLAVAALLFVGGYKVVRKPGVYYTPNADFFADVQNADYKTFFKLTYEKFPDFDITPVFSNLYDPFSWYSNKKPEALFMTAVTTPTTYSHYPVMIYPDLKYFLTEMKKYPKGFVFLEDWQSFMPEDIKSYIKKNLKLELRVESMSVSPDEKWPLELYSWGMK